MRAAVCLTAPPLPLVALSLFCLLPTPTPFRPGDFEEVGLKPQTLPRLSAAVSHDKKREVLNSLETNAPARRYHSVRPHPLRARSRWGDRPCPQTHKLGLALDPG